MSDRCEPNADWRLRDWWHWIETPDGRRVVWEWQSDAGWFDGPTWWSAPKAGLNGYRYHSPVATPADVEALRAERDQFVGLTREAEAEVKRLMAMIEAGDTELATLRARVEELRRLGQIITSLAPYGLPEDTATLHGQEAAEEMQRALEELRAALGDTP